MSLVLQHRESSPSLESCPSSVWVLSLVSVSLVLTKQYKCHHCCSCKNYQGKGMDGGKKCLCVISLVDQKIASLWGKCVLGHEQQVIACCQTHSDYGPPKMSLKLAV